MAVQLVVAAGSRTGHVIPVSTKKFIIGRATDCHLKATSELVSRYHCAILVGDDVVVRDLGSRNGVRLNSERINAEQKLNNGDKLTVGPLEFYISITADGEASMAEGDADGQRHLEDSGERGHSPTAPTVVLEHPKNLGT